MKCDICGKEAKTWGHCVCLECYITPKAKDKQLAIYKRALELACNDIQDMYCSDYCMCTRDESCKVKCCYQIYYNKEQFLDQAKRELEEQDVKD